MLEWIRRSEVAICYQKRTKTSEAIRKKTTVDLGQRKNKVAGYVRVSANTYAYGLRRGFALLVTGVTL